MTARSGGLFNTLPVENTFVNVWDIPSLINDDKSILMFSDDKEMEDEDEELFEVPVELMLPEGIIPVSFNIGSVYMAIHKTRLEKPI